MTQAKRFFKRNSHNSFFKALAGFGRALNRLYENRNHDIYSNGELTVIKKISALNPSVIIDGGANVGLYSLMLNQHIPVGTVYAFEPVESTYLKLVNNVKEHARIVPVMKGLYKEKCTRQINMYSADEHSSLYEIKGNSYSTAQKQSIVLVTGDDFLRENGIGPVDFLKLDVEGAEYDTLLGFHDTLKNGRIKAVQFEYGYINIATRKLLIDYYELFESYGYIVGKIFPRCVEFRKYDYLYEDFIGPNFIAVKNSESALISLLSTK